MSTRRTLLVAGVAASCVVAVVRAVSTRVINLGGGRTSDFRLTWADDPGLFGFAVIAVLALGAGCAVYVWKRWRQ